MMCSQSSILRPAKYKLQVSNCLMMRVAKKIQNSQEQIHIILHRFSYKKAIAQSLQIHSK